MVAGRGVMRKCIARSARERVMFLILGLMAERQCSPRLARDKMRSSTPPGGSGRSTTPIYILSYSTLKDVQSERHVPRGIISPNVQTQTPLLSSYKIHDRDPKRITSYPRASAA
ncbi:hypothetical protein M8818_007489 [Zalaria obscura]|uniref:Uncharacterized protein n=1 Tax=Zalaria obscura TaxID=2024903 RepID=A0ACC3S4F7_9PEZI